MTKRLIALLVLIVLGTAGIWAIVAQDESTPTPTVVAALPAVTPLMASATASGVTPTAPAETPSAAAETPSAAIETPSAPIDTPSAAAETPAASAGDVVAGKNLATQCIGCHSVDGTTVVGPSWKGIYGETVKLEDGTSVVVDDAYLANSIKDPLSQIVKGYPPAMPPYSWLTDQQVADIIAYIESLKE